MPFWTRLPEVIFNTLFFSLLSSDCQQLKLRMGSGIVRLSHHLKWYPLTAWKPGPHDVHAAVTHKTNYYCYQMFLDRKFRKRKLL